MKPLRVAFLALALAPARALGQAPSALEATALGVPSAQLLGAFPSLRQHPDGDTPRLEASWLWRPAPGRRLLVWIACVGAGDMTGCMVGVGRQSPAGRLVVLLRVPAGWDRPAITLGAASTTLRLSGSDGQCSWQRAVTWSPTGTLRLSPRRCVP